MRSRCRRHKSQPTKKRFGGGEITVHDIQSLQEGTKFTRQIVGCKYEERYRSQCSESCTVISLTSTPTDETPETPDTKYSGDLGPYKLTYTIESAPEQTRQCYISIIDGYVRGFLANHDQFSIILSPQGVQESKGLTPNTEYLQTLPSTVTPSMEYPQIKITTKLDITHELEKQLTALDEDEVARVAKVFSQRVKEMNQSLKEDNDDEKSIGSTSRVVMPSISSTLPSMTTVISIAQSLLNYDICDAENYKIYLETITKNFTPNGKNRGNAFLYRSVEQAKIDMYTFLMGSLQLLISDDDRNNKTYFVMKKELYKVNNNTEEDKKTFLLIFKVDQMNRLEPAKYFSNLAGTTKAIELIETMIYLLEKVQIKNETKKLSVLKFATHSLLRLRIIYGLNGKGQCDRITNLLKGTTKDLFGNDYKIADADADLTNKEKMLKKCRDKFWAVDPRRSRCIRLVKSRLNFNDVLKMDCTLKDKSTLKDKRDLTGLTEKIEGGHKKRQIKKSLNKKIRHKWTQKKHEKIMYGGGDEAFLVAFAVLSIIFGAVLLGTAAVGNPFFITGAILLGLGVMIFWLIFSGGDDGDDD